MKPDLSFGIVPGTNTIPAPFARTPREARPRGYVFLLAALSMLSILAAFALDSTGARADTPAPVVPVALAPVQRDTVIELVAVTLDADITESDGHTLVAGNSTFKLHNTDKMNDLQVPLGFPGWPGDPYAFDPGRLSSFAVSVDGKKVTLTPSRADLKLGSAVRAVDWYTWTLPIAADEKKTVRIDFSQDLGDALLPRFVYGLAPAGVWKGSIGSSRLTLTFPNSTTAEQVVAASPATLTFDGASVTWRFAANEPPTNPTLTIIKPSAWNDLLARRRTLQQNPNDAAAHVAVGTLFRQLAQTDSSRRDSYYAQAVAELETAVRIDPNQRAARSGLGALYEMRAGPAAGPRQIGYVTLAVAQWETLAATDATARKQLAEDYFYLGLDSHTRGEFAEALAFFDKATTFAPAGAGPLFTVERAAAQRKALFLTWARSLLDQGDYAGAADKARTALGDAFMTSYAPPSFYAGRVQVTMAPGTRTMVFRLVPFGVTSSELLHSLGSVAGALRATGTEVDITPDNPDVVLTLAIPFSTQAELDDKLSALAKALPAHAEWSQIRATVSPPSMSWDAPGGLFTHAINYREQVDLAQACGQFDKQLKTIAATLTPLENSAGTDAESLAKRALLKNAQNGWQLARAGGRADYYTGDAQTTVNACSAQTVVLSSAPLRLEVLTGLVVVLAALVALMAVVAVKLPRRRRSKAQERHGITQKHTEG